MLACLVAVVYSKTISEHSLERSLLGYLRPKGIYDVDVDNYLTTIEVESSISSKHDVRRYLKAALASAGFPNAILGTGWRTSEGFFRTRYEDHFSLNLNSKVRVRPSYYSDERFSWELF